jgi:tetratricopeptide (TPR) repeat protein
LAIFDRVLELEPSATRWGNKTVALMRLGRYEEALESLEQSLALDPTDGDVWLFKSILLKQLGREQEAEEARAQAENL